MILSKEKSVNKEGQLPQQSCMNLPVQAASIYTAIPVVQQPTHWPLVSLRQVERIHRGHDDLSSAATSFPLLLWFSHLFQFSIFYTIIYIDDKLPAGDIKVHTAGKSDYCQPTVNFLVISAFIIFIRSSPIFHFFT